MKSENHQLNRWFIKICAPQVSSQATLSVLTYKSELWETLGLIKFRVFQTYFPPEAFFFSETGTIFRKTFSHFSHPLFPKNMGNLGNVGKFWKDCHCQRWVSLVGSVLHQLTHRKLKFWTALSAWLLNESFKYLVRVLCFQLFKRISEWHASICIKKDIFYRPNT